MNQATSLTNEQITADLADLMTYPSPHGTLVRLADVKCALARRVQQHAAPIQATSGTPAEQWQVWDEVAPEIFPMPEGVRIGVAATIADAEKIVNAHNASLVASATTASASPPADVGERTASIDLDNETLWEIHGVVKNAGSTRLAHKISDALARRAQQHAAPIQATSGTPAGYKLVPLEPTPEMQHAGHDTPGAHMYNASYRAMVAAAPVQSQDGAE